MEKDRDEYQSEKRKQEQKLETLLLEALESGPATPLTKADFNEIKLRVATRLKAKKDSQNHI